MSNTTLRIGGGFRRAMQPSGPGRPGKIEKARDPRHALKRLLPYLAPFRTRLLAVLAMVLTYTLLGLVGPYLMGLAIDRFIATKTADGLAKIALAMLSAYVMWNLFQMLAAGIMATVSQGALKQLRRDLFTHLQALPLDFFDRNPAGELMSRLTNDIDAINQAVSQNIMTLLAGILSLVGILVAMFLLNLWLALASVMVVPLLFWFTGAVARYTRKGFRELQRHMGGLNTVMEEAVSGQKVVTAFGRRTSVIEDFRRHNHAVFKAGVYANNYAMTLMPLTGVLGNLFVIVLAGLGGWLSLKGLVSVGVIATFINYGQNFIQPLRQLANVYNAVQAALAGAERVFEILDIPAEPDDAPADAPQTRPLRGALRFENVSFGYLAGAPVINNMSLEAFAGRTVALVGPTGAGKTTVINLLMRFYEIGSGRITIDGTDIRAIPKARLRGRLGLVLQDTFLFSATVMENIRYGRLDATDDQCMAAAGTAGADRFIRQLPQGYQTRLSERAGNLSQGQRQLLAIARVILMDPDILILDEATSSIDTLTERHLQAALLSLMKGRTSVVIAHRLSTIRDADQLLVIENGDIVEKGTHRELMDQRGLYHHLTVSQFKGRSI